MNPIPIHARNPGPITGDGNWTWLIPGRVPTLIDAGAGDPRHLEELEEALAGVSLGQVLVTHGHSDHASGAAAIAARMPQVRFRKMPWADRDAKWGVPWDSLADGDTVEAGDSFLMAIHTPGHAPDHLCFWHPGSRGLFCGDLAILGTTVWIPARHGGDLGDYLQSLERVIALEPLRMLPAHGRPIEDPVALLGDYLRHRREREEQVLEALRGGDGTLDAMVARIYGNLKETLVPLARESVLAHLMKLERERRARQAGEEWQLADA